MEHTSTRKFINVHEQIGRIQQNLLDIQSNVQKDESTFAQINQAYQQVNFLKFSKEKEKNIFIRNKFLFPFYQIKELYNATICKYLRSLPLGADIEGRVIDK